MVDLLGDGGVDEENGRESNSCMVLDEKDSFGVTRHNQSRREEEDRSLLKRMEEFSR